MKDYAFLNNVPIIQDEGIEFLIDVIRKYQVKTILEIGTAIGYSSIMMAKTDKNLKILTLEIDKSMYELAQENIKYFNLNKQIEVYNTDANKYISKRKFDLIFLDGPKAQYANLVDNFYENLNVNGIIVVDNLAFHGLVFKEKLNVNRRTRQLINKIKLFRKNVVNDERFVVTLYDDIGDGMGLLIKK